MKKFIAMLLVLCLALGVLAACGNTAPAAPATPDAPKADAPAADEGKQYGDPIIIGVTTPVTGPQAAGGLQVKMAVELRVKECNEAGGILLDDGLYHKVEVKIEDDQGDTTLVDTTVRKLVSEGAVAIVGPYFSGMTLALDATMRELGVMQINSATSVKVDDLENPWLWHCRCDDGLNVLILGKAVMEDYTAKHGSLEGLKVGIVCANDETGTSAAASYMEYFDKNGVEYYVDYHNKDDADLSAYVQKAIGEGVNAWVSSTHDIAAAALAKAMYEAGLRDQIVYMNPILAQSAVLDLMEPEWVEGWGCACDYSATDTRPLPAAFTAAWYAEYGTDIIPDVTGALYYNHTHVLLYAIEQAKSADPAKIRDAVAAINGLETLAGTVYSDKYTNMLYEISIAKIIDMTPTIVGSVSMAKDMGFGG